MSVWTHIKIKEPNKTSVHHTRLFFKAVNSSNRWLATSFHQVLLKLKRTRKIFPFLATSRASLLQREKKKFKLPALSYTDRLIENMNCLSHRVLACGSPALFWHFFPDSRRTRSTWLERLGRGGWGGYHKCVCFMLRPLFLPRCYTLGIKSYLQTC